MNIFVGNLLFEATEADVRKAFEHFGSVASVTIVMDGKGRKSRGFGFVEMADDKEAQEAIATLDGKEFMGRVIHVEAARPRVEGEQRAERKKKIRPKPEFQKGPQEGQAGKSPWFNPVFKRTGRYKEGRRTHSFMRKRIEAGITEPLPERKSRENPMRWRKKYNQAKPWQRAKGEVKPWQKNQETGITAGPLPERKSQESPMHWRKKQVQAKPWQRAKGEVKPWQKNQEERKPWQKSQGEREPWKKAAGETRTWRKEGKRPQQSRFKDRKGPVKYRNKGVNK